MGIKVEDLNRKTSLVSGGESLLGEVQHLSEEELKITGGGHHGHGNGYGNSKEEDDGVFFSRGPGNSRELFYAPGDGGDDDVFFSRGPGNSRELFSTV
jgi:carbamoylphosphate synthase small subunit